ncbi:Spermidine export MdtI [Fagus crenata]
MDWLHRVKRDGAAVYTPIRACNSVGTVGRGGGDSIDDYGLLKLHDDVQMCGYQDVQMMWKMLGYQDVQMMWKMLSKSQKEQIAANKTTFIQRLKRTKQCRSSWKVFFWTNNCEFNTP